MGKNALYDLPATCQLIEVHVADLKQLFHSLDPTPFRERDLDPKAEEFIAGWARELDARRALALGFKAESTFEDIIRVHLDDELGGKIA